MQIAQRQQTAAQQDIEGDEPRQQEHEDQLQAAEVFGGPFIFDKEGIAAERGAEVVAPVGLVETQRRSLPVFPRFMVVRVTGRLQFPGVFGQCVGGEQRKLRLRERGSAFGTIRTAEVMQQTCQFHPPQDLLACFHMRSGDVEQGE